MLDLSQDAKAQNPELTTSRPYRISLLEFHTLDVLPLLPLIITMCIILDIQW